jgi:probable HAF family extracellular repeat protein
MLDTLSVITTILATFSTDSWAKDGIKTVDFPLSQARTSLYGVNNYGSVVGQIFLETQGTIQSFVLEGGKFTIVKYAGSVSTQAYGINDHDTVSGTYQLGTQDYGFLWSQGQFSTISVPAQHAAWVTGLNDLGDVVGYYFEGKGSDRTNAGFAYIKKTNERFTLSFPGALNTWAMAINNLGQIVGFYQLSNQSNEEAFLYADGVYTAIGPFANGAVAWGINDTGVIVGQLGQFYGGWLGFVATPVASGGLRDALAGPTCGQQ